MILAKSSAHNTGIFIQSKSYSLKSLIILRKLKVLLDSSKFFIFPKRIPDINTVSLKLLSN